jgi:hypothetical protein
VLGRLENVVVQPLLHRLDGDLLAARPGEHDDWHVGITVLHAAEHLDPVGPAQHVIRDDQVEPVPLQDLGEPWGGRDPFQVGARELFFEFPKDEKAVLLAVIQHHNP